MTIVGDVGSREKLDYTAYGDAVNAAARLEAAKRQAALGVTRHRPLAWRVRSEERKLMPRAPA
jgi:class 3 adenylate cyclase